ncbi:MAG TPA: PEP-CTERM sorting domain-containing protein [Acidobacteriota bacterium]|nr:PEP-CTERM sorting domain-containing protein [Acidobacteriota bacterium]
MKRVFAPVVCILLLTLITTGAHAATINLTAADLIGTIYKGTPASIPETYANTLINFFNIHGPVTGPFTEAGQEYRVFGSVTFGSLDPVTTVGQLYINNPAFPLSINDPYLYLYVKFGAGSALFYLNNQVGDLTSIFFPGTGNKIFKDTGMRIGFPSHKGVGDGVSHIYLFNPRPTKVPEPGTLLLLGSGLLAMGFTGRRWFRK